MVDEEEPVWHPVHRSLTRPDLVAGCERMPLVFLFSLAFVFIIILQKPIVIGIGIAIMIFGIPGLRIMAKRDPMMYRIWMRHYSYKSAYSPHPGLSRPAPRLNIAPGSIIDHQRKKGHTA